MVQKILWGITKSPKAGHMWLILVQVIASSHLFYYFITNNFIITLNFLCKNAFNALIRLTNFHFSTLQTKKKKKAFCFLPCGDMELISNLVLTMKTFNTFVLSISI